MAKSIVNIKFLLRFKEVCQTPADSKVEANVFIFNVETSNLEYGKKVIFATQTQNYFNLPNSESYFL